MPSILNATTTSGLVTSADNSGSLQLQTNNGTTAVTIDTSQNVGIGTSSPATKLNVFSSTTNTARLRVTGTGSTTGNFRGYEFGSSGGFSGGIFQDEGTSAISFWSTSSNESMRITSGGNLIVGATSADSAVRTAVVYAGGTYSSSAMNQSTSARGIDIIGSSNDTSLSAALQLTQFNATGRISQTYTSTQVGAMTFGLTNGSANIVERMRITSGGDLCVGTTTVTGSARETIAFTSSSGGTGISYIDSQANNTATFAGFYSNTTKIGSITNNGNTATSYNTSSDYRLKENIAPMTGALNVVQQLNPVTYNWKADGSSGQGFIAHELQAVVPDCVTGEKDAVDEEGKPAYQGIDTSFLVATLTAAIQEQQAQIEELKAEVQALKGVA